MVEVFGKDEAGIAGVQALVRERGIDYPVLFDPASRNANVLELKGLPAAFLLDAQGTVVWEGYLTGENLAVVPERIAQLLALPESQSAAPAGFLGVELGEPRHGGVAIVRVIADSPAQRLGLAQDDVLLSVGGHATYTADDVRARVGSWPAGARAELVWRSADFVRTGTATLGEPPRRVSPRRVRQAERVFEVARVVAGQTIADVGFGGGWLALALAEAVGPEGVVYAAEIARGSVEALRGRAPENLVVLLSQPGDAALPVGACDIVILHDVASHVSKPARPAFYASLERALKPNGVLVVFGPHGDARAVLEELAGYGFRVEDAAALATLSNKELDDRLDGGLRFFPTTR